MIENRQAQVYHFRGLVRYTGRIDAELELGDRILLILNDGSAVLHAFDGVKPKNWMPSGSNWYWQTDTLLVGEHEKRGEKLEIYVDQIHQEMLCEGQMHGKLIKLGSEREVSDWLAENPEELGYGYHVIDREYPTSVGPIDLLLERDGDPLIVEVKRLRVTGGEVIYQLVRYLEALQKTDRWKDTNIQGVLVAPGIGRAAQQLLVEKGILFHKFEYPPKSN